MKKFQINKFITLKLEEGNTNIYLNNNLFLQCKQLLMNLNENEIKSYNKLKSINDEIDQLFIDSETKIPPETEFWDIIPTFSLRLNITMILNF